MLSYYLYRLYRLGYIFFDKIGYRPNFYSKLYGKLDSRYQFLYEGSYLSLVNKEIFLGVHLSDEEKKKKIIEYHRLNHGIDVIRVYFDYSEYEKVGNDDGLPVCICYHSRVQSVCNINFYSIKLGIGYGKLPLQD